LTGGEFTEVLSDVLEAFVNVGVGEDEAGTIGVGVFGALAPVGGDFDEFVFECLFTSFDSCFGSRGGFFGFDFNFAELGKGVVKMIERGWVRRGEDGGQATSRFWCFA